MFVGGMYIYIYISAWIHFASPLSPSDVLLIPGVLACTRQARVDDILGELKVRRKGEGKKKTGGAKSVLHDDKVQKLKAKIHMPFDTNTFEHVLFTVYTCFFWGGELIAPQVLSIWRLLAKFTK